MTGNEINIDALENSPGVDLVENPECFLALLFWLTISVFGMWLFIHDPGVMPMFVLAIASGTFLLSSFLIIRNAFSISKQWGTATLLLPALMYVHLSKNFKLLKCETLVNLVSLLIILVSSSCLP